MQEEDDALALDGDVPGELDDPLVLVVLAVKIPGKSRMGVKSVNI